MPADTPKPVCPHCGNEEDASGWGMKSGETSIAHCGACGERYVVTCEREPSDKHETLFPEGLWSTGAVDLRRA